MFQNFIWGRHTFTWATFRWGPSWGFFDTFITFSEQLLSLREKLQLSAHVTNSNWGLRLLSADMRRHITFVFFCSNFVQWHASCLSNLYRTRTPMFWLTGRTSSSSRWPLSWRIYTKLEMTPVHSARQNRHSQNHSIPLDLHNLSISSSNRYLGTA